MAQIDVANPPKPAGMPIDRKYLYYDPAYVAKGFGLNNIGSICWFNSALQSLISCSQFNNIILKKEEQLKDNRIATTYIELIKKSFQAEDLSSLSTYSTTLLIALVNELKKQKKISDLLTIGQKDASEGLLMLLDLIGCKPLEVLFYHRYETDSICLKCDKVSYTNKTEPPNIMNVLSFRKEISDSKDFVKEILFHWVPNDGIKCENCGEQTDNSVVLYKLKMMRELTMIVIRNTAENLINRHGKNVFFNDTATTEIYTLSLHDALPICPTSPRSARSRPAAAKESAPPPAPTAAAGRDRKSTRLNSSHQIISYAVFCLKKKKKPNQTQEIARHTTKDDSTAA